MPTQIAHVIPSTLITATSRLPPPDSPPPPSPPPPPPGGAPPPPPASAARPHPGILLSLLSVPALGPPSPPGAKAAAAASSPPSRQSPSAFEPSSSRPSPSLPISPAGGGWFCRAGVVVASLRSQVPRVSSYRSDGRAGGGVLSILCGAAACEWSRYNTSSVPVNYGPGGSTPALGGATGTVCIEPRNM